MKTVWCALIWLVVSTHGYSQTSDYPPERENALQRSKPGKQLFKEDEACGGYLWKSEKADRSGAVVLYYFYGSTEYGKGKLGMYQQVMYRVTVDEAKDPPTAQAIKDGSGGLKEVRLRMTRGEFEASRGCFPGQ